MVIQNLHLQDLSQRTHLHYNTFNMDKPDNIEYLSG